MSELAAGSDPLELQGRVVLVTGAGHGLGRAHALELASQGALVVVNDLGGAVDGAGQDSGPAEAVVEEIRNRGGTAVADSSSVATREGAAAMVETALRAFGRLDAVVNNAGILRDRSVANVTSVDLEVVLDVHLRGTLWVSQAAWSALISSGHGRLVHTTSAAALFGNFGQSAYAAAKAAVVGLSRVLAEEGRRHGIASNVISPLAATRLAGELFAGAADQLDPALVSPLVAVLCSPTFIGSGEVFTAGAGRFARVATGVTGGWSSAQPTAADVAAHVEEIRATDGLWFPNNASEEVLAAVDRGPRDEQLPAGLRRGVSSADLLLTALRRYDDDRTAFVHGERRLTYREVRAQMFQLARAITKLGVRQGDGIAYLSANRPEAFLLSAAALVLGCRCTPLHPLGSAADHRFAVEDSDAALVVVDETFADRLTDLVGADPTLVACLGTHPTAPDLLALAGEESAADLAPVPSEDDLALLLYTGGTTGRPKGVMISHRALVANTMMTLAEWEWPAEIRFLACTPMSHGVGAMIGPILLRGGTVVINNGFDPDALLATMARERITATFMVPTMLYVLLDHPGRDGHDLSSLQTVIYGAAPISPSRLAQAIDVFGPVFMQLYAQSEAPNTVAALRKSDHDPSRPELLSSCGTPLAGIDVQLLDEHGERVPDGAVGEICVRGPLLMDGYWKQPELTAHTLRGGWLHTGDMARQDRAGYLYIVDRQKDMIVSGGFNVYPREVEDCLTEHPHVRMAAVIGVPDAKWGESVRALVVPVDGVRPDEEQLIGHVRQRKGPVCAPKTLEIVESLPLTALGKPDKRALREAVWAGHGRAVH